MFLIFLRQNMVYGKGSAGSKKEAEQLAAKDALQKAQNGR